MASNKNAPEYEITKESYNNNPAYIKKLQLFNWQNQINEFIKGLDGKKVLDAGCGAGRDIKEFLNKGFEVTGVDYSVENIKVAKQSFPRAKLFEGNILQMGFIPGNSFDGVWACASVLHVKKADLQRALQEFRRVLKPKGRLFVSVKKGEGEKIVEDEAGKRFFSFYKESEMKEAIERAGFKVTKIEVVRHEQLTGRDPQKPDWICLYAQKT
ncbi:MAG: class I SAM-dependent methyltransferase [archaeon]|nr:class I SAM-dependent methyltransferase [archaeon]